jgi:ferredoxin
MAELHYQGEKKEIQDGEQIAQACKGFGVAFGCNEGLCGSCAIDILDGAENLSPLTENEEAFGFDEKKRLGCQAKIIKGKVTFEF